MERQKDDVKTSATLLRAIHDRVVVAKGEVTTQLSDLMVFIGYFGLCLYAGGVASIEAYNAEMKLVILSTDNFIATSQIFLMSLMGTIWSAFALFVGIIVISYVYVVARFALRLWLGISLVMGLFCSLLIFCVVLGSSQGAASARAAFNSADDSLPVIKISDPTDRDLSDGRYRLLHDSSTHLFVVRPTGSPGLGQIRSFLKDGLPSYEVLIQ